MRRLRFDDLFSVFNRKKMDIRSCAAGLFILSFASIARGQIFLTQGNDIEEYSLNGTPINTDFITIPNLDDVSTKLAVEGNDLFVLHDGTVSEYTTGGQLVNATVYNAFFDTGSATAITVSGDKMFLSILRGRTSPNTIEEFTTAGVLLNSSLGVAFPEPQFMTVSGDNVFVESDPAIVLPPINGQLPLIAQFSISGGTSNSNFITGGFGAYFGLAQIGNDLFTTDFNTQNIAEFTTSGTLVTSTLLPGLNSTLDIVSGGDDLFAATQQGNIAEYTADGTIVNANLITGLAWVNLNIAVEVPEPGALESLVLCGSIFLLGRRGSWRLG
jgi:hypothetical protein